MSKKSVFISYDYDNDRSYKNLLLAWDKNQIFDFYINDVSADISINSNDSSVIKRAITEKISRGSVFLVLVGRSTYQSTWVRWEITKAVELGKKIVAVKIDQNYSSPSELFNVGANWAMSFSFDSIKNAIES